MLDGKAVHAELSHQSCFTNSRMKSMCLFILGNQVSWPGCGKPLCKDALCT